MRRNPLMLGLREAPKAMFAMLRNKSGNYSVIFSLAAVAIAAVAGLGVDFSSALNQRSVLKNAMDAALLGGMAQKHEEDEQIELAEEIFESNLYSFEGTINNVDIHHDPDGRLVGIVNADVSTALMQVVGVDSVAVSIKSVVVRGPQTGHPLCIMAMHPTRKHTLELKDEVSLYGTDCHIYGNSNHVDDVVDPHSPDNYITAASVTAVGYGHHYIQNITPPLEGSTAVIADPYLGKSLPAVGSCTHSDHEIDGQTVTLNPGTYCGGLTIEDSVVTLNPGLYIIQGDTLEIEESTVTGTGVTLFLADRHAEMEISESEIRLSAPVSGTWTSFVLLAKRDENEWEFEDSTIDMYGIVYAPNSSIEWVNTGTPTITAEWTAWITDGFSWTGDGVINFPYSTAGATVPHPSSLNVIPRPSLSEVVRLVE